MKLLPHLPATCPDCYRLLTPAEQQVADVVRRLIVGAPLNEQTWHTPMRVPLCLEGQAEAGPFVIERGGE